MPDTVRAFFAHKKFEGRSGRAPRAPPGPPSQSRPQCLVNLTDVESDNCRAADDDHGSGHIPEFLETGQGVRILRDVLLLNSYALLRKILFPLVAEHSPMLGINDDVLHLFSAPVGSLRSASKRRTAALTPLITSRTGWSE